MFHLSNWPRLSFEKINHNTMTLTSSTMRAGKHQALKDQAGIELKCLKQSTGVLWLYCQPFLTRVVHHRLHLWSTEPSVLHMLVLNKCSLCVFFSSGTNKTSIEQSLFPSVYLRIWNQASRRISISPQALGIREKKVWIPVFSVLHVYNLSICHTASFWIKS